MESIFLSHKTKNIDFRIKQLKKLKTAILEFENKLSIALFKDLGKSKIEAYTSEIGFCLYELSFHIKNLKSWTKPKTVSTDWRIFPLAKSFIKKEPLGNILIIAPWNYPFGLSISPLIGAISAGNCVTLKPSELSSHTSQIIKEMIEKHFDKQYIHVVQGGAKKTQELLKENYDYIFFTGGEHVGKIVMEAASKNLTPFTLELGGKSPCIIHRNCNLEKTANRIVYGKFLNAGQTCIAPDYLLVDKRIKDNLIEQLKKKINLFFGDNIENSKDFGRIINNKHFERLENYLKDVKIIFGGKTNKTNRFISPTIVENAENEQIMQEEIFGPILPIIEYSDENEVIEFINKRPKPLALYIFSESTEFQENILHKTSSGGVCINDTLLHIVNKNLPFGGVANSGFGKYHGKTSFDTFSNTKSVFINTNLFEIPKRYPPFEKVTLKIMKKIFKYGVLKIKFIRNKNLNIINKSHKSLLG
jgi:aldehyde dehydrogenase (NAD+)